MALVARYNALHRLQTEVPRGAPVDSAQLASLGVSSALAHHYLKSGWLSRLGRGVFQFPNDDLREADCLKFLARQVDGFHVGGKTALAWRGFGHNVPAREPLWLWGNRNRHLPDWFTERFPARYTTRSPFASDLPPGLGLEPLPDQPNGVAVSVPERALLEMLSEVGIHQGVEEAKNITEGVRSLRPEVLALLLQHCLRVKAARLCVHWAEELQLPWAAAARKAAAQHMTGSRWSARLKSGIRLSLSS
jgi:Transcriptional regulator, AbiEi antitoxin, Type IV TA system/Transcriptional regulator, AbiEi antitoxin N-terminal domain